MEYSILYYYVYIYTVTQQMFFKGAILQQYHYEFYLLLRQYQGYIYVYIFMKCMPSNMWNQMCVKIDVNYGYSIIKH